MADADVPITSGTGTKIDTRTVGAGTDEHRQVVVVGDPATAANVQAVSAAGAAKVDGSAVTQPVSISSAPQIAVNNVETITDNAGFTDGTSKVFPQGYVFDEVAGTGLTENDVAAARVDSKRAIVNVIEDAVTRGRRVIVSATGGMLGDQGAPAAVTNAWYVRPRTVATYAAGFRLAAATAGATHASFTFVANTDKQLATIYHTGAATKTVRLRYCSITLAQGAAGIYSFELRGLSAATAPATGNPAITPRPYDPADAAAEAACLTLPTTAGSEAAANGPVSPNFTWNSPAGATQADPARAGEELVLVDARSGTWDRKAPSMRAGTAEGYAIIGRCNAAVAFNFTCFMEFTEE